MTGRARREKATEVEGIRLTHPGRVLYPEQGLTKRDLVDYYQVVAPWMLPHVVGRPLSLVRCPSGEGGTCFYQKHFDAGLPEGVHGIAIAEKEAGGGTYAIVEDVRSLIGLVQIGVLELHPWGATADRLEQPDILIFDFDPGAGVAWAQVVGAAIEMRDLLARLELESFAKTTGGKGLHVVVPIKPRLGWERIKAVAHAIAAKLAAAAPERYTIELAKSARRERIFIDYLRNSRGATAVAPYSPRARAGAPVATPLAWAEVEPGLRPDRLTVTTVPERLKRLGDDPWAEMKGRRQSLGAGLLRALGV